MTPEQKTLLLNIADGIENWEQLCVDQETAAALLRELVETASKLRDSLMETVAIIDDCLGDDLLYGTEYLEQVRKARALLTPKTKD